MDASPSFSAASLSFFCGSSHPLHRTIASSGAHLQFQVACHYRVFFLFHIVRDGVAVKNSGHGSIDTSADTGLPYRNLYFLVFVVVIDDNDNLLFFIKSAKREQIIILFQYLYSIRILIPEVLCASDRIPVEL